MLTNAIHKDAVAVPGCSVYGSAPDIAARRFMAGLWVRLIREVTLILLLLMRYVEHQDFHLAAVMKTSNYNTPTWPKICGHITTVY
jgi:hypothetical protein